ncbi:hypothetical protein ACTMU2_40520 [Cupriavidus basilensis]
MKQLPKCRCAALAQRAVSRKSSFVVPPFDGASGGVAVDRR